MTEPHRRLTLKIGQAPAIDGMAELMLTISREGGNPLRAAHVNLSVEELSWLVVELDLAIESRDPKLSLRRRVQEDVLDQFRAMVQASREVERNEPAGPQPLYPPTK